MAIFIVCVSLTVALSLYLYFCLKTRLWINVLTPIFLIAVPARYLFELVYLLSEEEAGSAYGYFVIYALYTLELLGFVIGYMAINRNLIVKWVRAGTVPAFFAWVFLVLGFVFYAPVLFEYSAYILSPREIYVRTRTGYGINYFVSLLLANFAFLVFLFAEKINVLARWIFLALLFFLIGTHGSKGAFVTVFFIYLMYLVYIRNINQSITKTIYFVFILGGLVSGLFYFTLPETMKSNFLQGVISYSDYTRHAVMVVDDPPPVQYGKLILEDNFLAPIPRAIYKDKPKDFGAFFLSKHYFPDWFYGDTGSPAFGVGTYYADFREIAFIVIFFISFFVGLLTKMFVNRLVRFKSPSDFIMLLFFSGVPLLNLGAGYPLIPHLLLSFLFVICVKFLASASQNHKKMK